MIKKTHKKQGICVNVQNTEKIRGNCFGMGKDYIEFSRAQISATHYYNYLKNMGKIPGKINYGTGKLGKGI